MSSRAKPFLFFNMWTEDNEFMPKVQKVWHEDVRGVKMYKVIHKLKRLKGVLKKLNRNKFSDVENVADSAYKKIA